MTVFIIYTSARVVGVRGGGRYVDLRVSAPRSMMSSENYAARAYTPERCAAPHVNPKHDASVMVPPAVVFAVLAIGGEKRSRPIDSTTTFRANEENEEKKKKKNRLLLAMTIMRRRLLSESPRGIANRTVTARRLARSSHLRYHSRGPRNPECLDVTYKTRGVGGITMISNRLVNS